MTRQSLRNRQALKEGDSVLVRVTAPFWEGASVWSGRILEVCHKRRALRVLISPSLAFNLQYRHVVEEADFERLYSQE